MITASLLVLLGYLTGSLASAVIVCRLLGLGDPRSEGSGNPGTTNVMRLYGKRAALLTLAGDVLKGLLPVVLAQALGASLAIVALTGLAAFSGHLFPVFFSFRGGKGVATLIGVLFGLHWSLGLGYVLTWLLTAALFRYSSLAGLIAALTAPLYASLLLPQLEVVGAVAVMSLLLIWRHKSNITKLLAGTEDRIGGGKTETQ